MEIQRSARRRTHPTRNKLEQEKAHGHQKAASSAADAAGKIAKKTADAATAAGKSAVNAGEKAFDATKAAAVDAVKKA